VVQDDWADQVLRRGLLARDAQALEALISRYAREVAYFIRVVLDGVGTVQDAEECVNDLFVAVWEDAESFDPARGTLRTWLMMRAKYLALDRRRVLHRRQVAIPPALSVGALDDGSVGAAGVASAQSVDGMIEQRERQLEVRSALEELPELDRQLVYLRYFRLATTEEIAARTGLTHRAIDTRLWRARRVLRDALESVEERRHGQVRALRRQ
jgi:RNA polymerase sigma factor (sigma-70 family)